jgi:hypothetical protein
MPNPEKFYAVNYPVSTVLLVIAGMYLYFLSPFAGNLFFLIFFVTLALLSFYHKYALEITNTHIAYKPFPVFSTRTVKIADISKVLTSNQSIKIQTLNGKPMIIGNYFLKKKQWPLIIKRVEAIAKSLESVH